MTPEKTYHVLIADDQPDNVFLLKTLLQRDPRYKVGDVSDGLQALGYVIEEDVDLVLMDVMMPEMDGNEATRKIRERFSDSELPIIMVTTLNDADHLVESFEAGANDYLSKPIEWHVLQSRMNSALKVREATLAQKKSMGRVKALNQRLKEFSFAVAHDIRSPLAQIQVICQAMRENLMGADEASDQIEKLSAQVCEFMDSILEYAAYSRSSEITGVDLNQIVERAKVFLNPLVLDKHAQIKCGHLPVIQASENLVFQVFLNLLSNSLKYSSEDRETLIDIHSREDDRCVVLTIEDNGVGMEDRDLKQIEKPLTRGESSHGTKGTGLGLSLVKNVLEELNGEFKISSTPGEGTKVELTFWKA